MLIDPRIFVQQNNIFNNREQRISLTYSENARFYKVLDAAVLSGNTIKIMFAAEKMTEDCCLQKRISNCANARDFFELMSELWDSAMESIRHIAERNIFGLWEITNQQTLKMLYSAYIVEFHIKGSSFLRLTPLGNGTNSKTWMIIA
jgi:hypothetical protein